MQEGQGPEDKCPGCLAQVNPSASFCAECGTRLGEPDQADGGKLVGETLAGKFRIEEHIGDGAMGSVFRAHHLELDTDICIKVMLPDLARNPVAVRRFRREARAAARLKHPNSISVLDFGKSRDGTLYLAMEFVNGRDLHTVLKRESLIEQGRALGIAYQICLALEEAHAHKVIHRDLKPANIMLADRRREKDFVTVLDFGIASIMRETGSPRSDMTFGTEGLLCGTPAYMSPEQIQGEQLDGRSDIYSLGVMLCEMCTGQLPFYQDSLVELANMHLFQEPLPPRLVLPELHPAVDSLLLGMLAKDRDERPADCAALGELLLRAKAETAVLGTQQGTGQASVGGRQADASETVADEGAWLLAEPEDDRRGTPRRPFSDELYCYISGLRCDADCVNISAGGAFLRTEATVPKGTVVAVVFKRQPEVEHSVYLMGAVAREQRGPQTGLGIRWQSAVSTGPPEELARFLNGLLGFEPAGVQVVDGGPDTEQRSLFRFGASPPEVSPQWAGPFSGLQSPPSGEERSWGAAETIQVRVVQRDEGGPADDEPAAMPAIDLEEVPASDPGVITERIGRDKARAPVRLDAALVVAGESRGCRIVSLGTATMFIEFEGDSPGLGDTVEVRLDIKLQDRTAPVRCRCRVVAVDDGAASGGGGADLDIVECDEGSREGILESYVRWLHFRFFSEQ